MKLGRRIKIVASAALLSAAVTLPASANFVVGDSIHGTGTDNFFLSTIFDTNATIGPGVEFTGTQNLSGITVTWTANFDADSVTLNLVTSQGGAAFGTPRDTFTFTGIALTAGSLMSDLQLVAIHNFSLGTVSFGTDSLTINVNSHDTRTSCCTASAEFAFPATAVPEPGSMALAGLGAAALALARRRRPAQFERTTAVTDL